MSFLLFEYFFFELESTLEATQIGMTKGEEVFSADVMTESFLFLCL